VYRVTAVESTGRTFDRDESFDLRSFWAEQSAQFVETLLHETVRIRLTPAGARRLRHAVEPPAAHRALQTAAEPDAQGRIVTDLPVESLDVAYDQLMRLGPEVEVLDPPELRDRMAE